MVYRQYLQWDNVELFFHCYRRSWQLSHLDTWRQCHLGAKSLVGSTRRWRELFDPSNTNSFLRIQSTGQCYEFHWLLRIDFSLNFQIKSLTLRNQPSNFSHWFLFKVLAMTAESHTIALNLPSQKSDDTKRTHCCKQKAMQHQSKCPIATINSLGK